MQIMLTNDDGIYAPGLAALERELRKLGDVCVCAPATEQSGVAHSITFLSPLTCKEIFDGDRRRGWAVEGSPADCVKLGVFELCPQRPDLVVSGINGGLNAGINVLYSGTVAAA
ncbi:MAG: 5'/3'-nucleotidase SurE, partial [Planctomycetales bacterium]|nr:5'/3'-nucleotidase SurE [Planctomycetales bacterium]